MHGPRRLAVTTREKEGDTGPEHLADVRPLIAAVADDPAPVADGIAGLLAQRGAEQPVDCCANCLERLPDALLATVRQLETAATDDAHQEPGLGAGRRRVPPVWQARRGGRPRQCDSPDPDNLQLLCKDCHHAKTNERMRPATDEQKELIAALVVTRVEPEVPALLADDEVRWKAEWSSLKKARRERLLDEMRAVGLVLQPQLG